jgi:hypothetical protein
MKIIPKTTKEKTCIFQDLQAGDVFRQGDNFFIVTEDYVGAGNAVNLCNGVWWCIQQNETVIPIKGSFVEE